MPRAVLAALPSLPVAPIPVRSRPQFLTSTEAFSLDDSPYCGLIKPFPALSYSSLPTPSQLHLAGTRLINGAFELEAQIGAGSYGAVYKVGIYVKLSLLF